MPPNFLHNHKEFHQLLNVISEEMNIIPQLIEKDYWIMHVLFGLQQQGFEFELKGGTSLSKGYNIIDRFSEDIDILIHPNPEQNIETNPRKTKSSHILSRKNYYDWLASNIKIDGIISVERETAFDNKHFSSGGIRLNYKSVTTLNHGVKTGILLEVGFDTATPNKPLIIPSWAYNKAISIKGVEIKDNRAINVLCYDPGYTLVEKLQTIATKFRLEKEFGIEKPNLMRQYYDVYCLLGYKEVNDFIGTEAYIKHKKARFPTIDLEIPIQENEAYLLSDLELRNRFTKRYMETSALYYKGQIPFDDLISRIHENLDRL